MILGDFWEKVLKYRKLGYPKLLEDLQTERDEKKQIRVLKREEKAVEKAVEDARNLEELEDIVNREKLSKTIELPQITSSVSPSSLSSDILMPIQTSSSNTPPNTSRSNTLIQKIKDNKMNTFLIAYFIILVIVLIIRICYKGTDCTQISHIPQSDIDSLETTINGETANDKSAVINAYNSVLAYKTVVANDQNIPQSFVISDITQLPDLYQNNVLAEINAVNSLLAAWSNLKIKQTDYFNALHQLNVVCPNPVQILPIS